MIIPSILTADPKELRHKLNLIKGQVNRVQVDIVDTVFGPDKTVGIEDLTGYPQELEVELHLMVDGPECWVERATKVKPKVIVAQVELMDNPEKYFTLTAEEGIVAGVAIDLPTSLELILPEVLIWAEKILIMGVKAGKGGQLLDRSVLEKIRQTRSLVGESKIIAVDGGMNETTIPECLEAGASEFVVGSAFWQGDNWVANLKRLEESVAAMSVSGNQKD